MGHYEKRLEEDLTRLRDRVGAVGTAVAEAVARSVQALLGRDWKLANEIVLGDLPINREIRDIDRACHAFVARHLPSAGHLRFVSSVLRMNVAIERIGDYAVTIGRETNQIAEVPPPQAAIDIAQMGDHAQVMLAKALEAFKTADADLARSTKDMAREADVLFGRVYRDLLGEAEAGTRPTRDLFALLTVFNTLERVTDQAKNICEETLFAVTGETKAPKSYRVLFVDTRNDCASQLAEAFARKAFPASGIYSSGGWTPAGEITDLCRSYLEEHGYDAGEMQPKPVDVTPGALATYHVIVNLDGDLRSRVPEPPFRTVLLDWEVGSLDSEAAFDEAFKLIRVRVRELMETLRGAEAD